MGVSSVAARRIGEKVAGRKRKNVYYLVGREELVGNEA